VVGYTNANGKSADWETGDGCRLRLDDRFIRDADKLVFEGSNLYGHQVD
jgi:hypothetical protein